MYLWKFSNTKFLEEFKFNSTLDSFFKHGINGLVRENIQNSLDHRADSNNPVEIVIEFGKIESKEIPGFNEIKDRINSLKPGNFYGKEVVEEMKSHLNDMFYDYVSFEEKNTQGLTGSKFGNSFQPEGENYSYNAYAYSKGIHFESKDAQKEKLRGGSHGIGKIASNAASIYKAYFFANCEEDNYQTLGGSIQLIDHEVYGEKFRSTGYFTDEINNSYFPYKNENFNYIFKKSTRGLKIIVPFLSEKFTDKRQYVRTICDSFMLAILKGDLIASVDNIAINKSTLENILNDEDIFPKDETTKGELFTKYYFETLKNFYSDNIQIADKHKKYRFMLYFNYDENINRGRTGIYRSNGMKIEDRLISSYGSKTYNALLLPYSAEEDEFLKSLENESHTKLDSSHLSNPEIEKNAIRFINNLDKKIGEIIDDEIRNRTPSEGVMDTDDIIYEIENKFKRDLENHLIELNYGEGKNKKTIVKVKSFEEKVEQKSTSRSEPKNIEALKKIKKQFGDNGSKDYYQIPGSNIKRYSVEGKEFLTIKINPNFLSGNKNKGNILVSLIDGMGIEFSEEFNLSDAYDFILDQTSNLKLPFSNSTIKQVSFATGDIKLMLKTKNTYNKHSKLKYYLEV